MINYGKGYFSNEECVCPHPKLKKNERAIRAERKIPDDKECVDRRGSNDGEENNSNDVIGHDQPSEYRLTIYRYAIIVSFSKYR